MRPGWINCLFLGTALQTLSVVAQAPPDQAAPPAGATLRVTGRVIDDVTGKPLAGAKVELSIMVIHVTFPGGKAPDPPPEPIPPREMTTGADGEFAFDNVPAVTIDLRATCPGYIDLWGVRRDPEVHLGTYLAEDLRSPILLRLAPQASIRGVIRNSAGASLGKTGLVTLWRLLSWEGWPRLEYGGWPTFDPDGTYHFDGLVPGRYYLLAGLDPVRQGPARFEDGHGVGDVPVRFPAPTDEDPNPFLILHEGEQAHVDFRLAETALYRVTLTGSPQSPVGLLFFDENRSAYMVREAEIGKLSEAWLPNGSYSLGNDAGEIDGPMPVEIKDSGISGLHYSIVPSSPPPVVSVHVEITSTLSSQAGCPAVVSVCGFVNLYMVRVLRGGYVEVSGQTNQAGRFDTSEGVNSQPISLLPGTYTTAIAVAGPFNLYARSARSGDIDLAVQPLVIRQGSTPDPIRIELAPGASVEGITRRGSKPGSAWVYAIPVNLETGRDFRIFEPVVSDENGKFRMDGLAPGPYLIFASTQELDIDLHDPKEVDYWRTRSNIVPVEAGKPVHLDLSALPPPDEPY